MTCQATDGPQNWSPRPNMASIDCVPKASMAAIGSFPLPQMVPQDHVVKSFVCASHGDMIVSH